MSNDPGPEFPKTQPAADSTVPPDPPTLALGAVPFPEGEIPSVPGYEVLEELGRGGMGVVYKARQLRPRRLVALKMVLTGAHASAADRARFCREAEAVAGLQHPHIVQVYEVGEHHGLPYFSLELVEGGSLARRLELGPLPPREAARCVELLARAVQAAHDKGIVHRDLKPANVLLLPDGTPKLTDFGLARLAADVQTLTASGAVLGTPGYLAPEQAGQNRTVGPGADVFALGATLYALLTGRCAFQGATHLDTVLQTMSMDPARPSSLNGAIPRDLDTICLKCLEKDPPRRYASALALAEDLERFLAGKPILARPVGALERAWRWCRRNAALAAMGGLALALLVVVAVLLWPERKPGGDRSLVRVQEAGTLRVLCDPDCPPMTFRRGGELVGFEVDLMKALAERLGVRLEIVRQRWDWDRWVGQLDAGEVDLVLSTITITDERSRRVDFLEYARAPFVFAAREGVVVKKPADLAGKVIAVQSETIPQQFIDKLRRDGIAFREVRLCDSTRGPFDAIRLGEAEVTLEHLPICRYFARQDRRLKVLDSLGQAIGPEPLGMAFCKRSQALRNAVAQALQAIQDDGAKRRMEEEWFGK